jgi:transposase
VIGTIRRQVDISPIVVQVTAHRGEIKVCEHCKRRVVASFPEGVNAPVQYGERIKAMTVYLNHQRFIPADQLSDVFSDLFNVSISMATIVKMGEGLAVKVGFFYGNR